MLQSGGPHLKWKSHLRLRLSGHVRARGEVFSLPFVCVEEDSPLRGWPSGRGSLTPNPQQASKQERESHLEQGGLHPLAHNPAERKSHLEHI